MRLQIRYSDGTRQKLTIPDDIHYITFVVGGVPEAVPYDEGHMLIYSDADKNKKNIKYRGRQYFGTIALMEKEGYENIFHR